MEKELNPRRKTMTWRKHETHKEETAAVKVALAAAGISARVGHGTGTAWGWLEINIGAGQQFGEHQKDNHVNGFCYQDCVRCVNLRAMSKKALEVAREVTGRHGEYDGEINIHAQDHWTDKKGSIPIEHPNWQNDAKEALLN